MATPNSLLNQLETRLEEFPRGEVRFARWVLKSPEEASTLSIQELSEKSGTSEPTIVRFSKRVGFKGFREFKLKLLESLKKEKTDLKIEALPQDLFSADQLTLSRTLKQLQDRVLQSLPGADLNKFLNKLVEAKHLLIFADPSLKEVAEIAYRQLLPFTKRLSLCYREDQYAGMLSRLAKSDVILLLHRGNSDILKHVQLAKTKKICIAVLGQLPAEPTVDVFLGVAGFSNYLELSILLSLTQLVELLPKHVKEAQKNADSFWLSSEQELNADPVKSLQGELWS